MRIFLNLVIGAGLSSSAIAQTQDQRNDAKWIVERITGVKWAVNDPIVLQAYQLAAQKDRAGIAALATQQPQFLNVTVKNFGLVMSTREETIRIPLNDFAATIMGVTRDESDARELLYGNFFYAGNPAFRNLQNNFTGAVTPQSLVPAFVDGVLRSNSHYAGLDNRRNNVGAMLVRIDGQKLIRNDNNNNQNRTITLQDNPDAAGILTSRSWIEAHAVAGTNRRPVEYTSRQFLCLPIEKWADAASSDVRIGRDIDRFPGGDHMKFQTTCKACHTVMDGFRGAWARWDFQGNFAVNTRVVANGNNDNNGVLNKLNRNAQVYPGGYVTTDESWVNNANRGANSALMGWRSVADRSIASGTGVSDFGRLVANSQRFSTCMAKRVFESVCRKSLSDAELALYQVMGSQFESTNYNLKKLFQTAALHPRCK
jgi:hypothetical protein